MIMSALILRWVARLSALLVAGGYTVMLVGEITHPHSGPPTTLVERAGIALLTATCIGMLLAWRWELPGAVISLASLVAFTLLIQMRQHAILFVFVAPGILFLVDWFVRRAGKPKETVVDGKAPHSS